eukprot:363275-Chlamydomonas_euryale.AAC.15
MQTDGADRGGRHSRRRAGADDSAPRRPRSLACTLTACSAWGCARRSRCADRRRFRGRGCCSRMRQQGAELAAAAAAATAASAAVPAAAAAARRGVPRRRRCVGGCPRLSRGGWCACRCRSSKPDQLTETVPRLFGGPKKDTSSAKDSKDEPEERILISQASAQACMGACALLAGAHQRDWMGTKPCR